MYCDLRQHRFGSDGGTLAYSLHPPSLIKRAEIQSWRRRRRWAPYTPGPIRALEPVHRPTLVLPALAFDDGNRAHFDKEFECLTHYGERWRDEATAALKALGLVPAPQWWSRGGSNPTPTLGKAAL